jgi:murein L,D-transpeptidase YcbB/YkuD
MACWSLLSAELSGAAGQPANLQAIIAGLAAGKLKECLMKICSFIERLPAIALALAFTCAMPAPFAQAESVSKFARVEAINWQGTVINVAPLMDFYKRRLYNGIWTAKQGLTPQGAELVQVLQGAASDGLTPEDYLSGLPSNVNALSGEHLAAAELYLSESAAKYARDLYGGRTTPAVTEPDIIIARKKLDVPALLGAMGKKGPKKVTDGLRPQHKQYAALRQLLAQTSNDAQRRKIIINMERWRWLPRDLGDEHLLVNTAGYTLYVRKDGKTIDSRKVIVGKPFHKTPMFSHNIEYAEFNPTWTVTPNIAGNEMLPKLRKDPSYLERIGYVLYTSWEEDAPAMSARQINWDSVSAKNFPYRIVQPAGPENVLGQVKFLFPNKFNVYLHDTSSRQLFSQSDRALSHGCIRVENPLQLAHLLYKLDNNPVANQVEAIVGTKKTTRAKFKRPIPIHLTYFTLWVGDDGKIQSYDDIYGRDQLVGNLLFGSV